MENRKEWKRGGEKRKQRVASNLHRDKVSKSRLKIVYQLFLFFVFCVKPEHRAVVSLKIGFFGGPDDIEVTA